MAAQRSLIGAVTALAFLVQSTGLAHAAPPPSDVQPVPPLPPQARPDGDAIYLKDGTALRGTLLETVPNDHATIQLSTGQNAIVPWSKIDRVIGRPLPTTMPGLTFVHVASDKDVVLESLAPGGQWEPACMAPCDAQLPLGNQYRLSGPSVRRSRPFAITANPGQQVLITVSPGSKGAFTGGVALVSAGAATAAVGLIIFTIGATQCSDGGVVVCDEGYAPSGVLVAAGAITLLVGAGALVGGVVLMSDSRTREEQTFAVALAPAARPDTAWLRAPMWHDTARDAPGLPRALAFPIFTRSF